MTIYTLASGAVAGLTPRQLRSSRFQRLMQGVYTEATTPLTLPTYLAAARAILPADATLTGRALLHLVGCVHGPFLPMAFITAGRVQRPEIEVIRRVCGDPTGALAPIPRALADADLSLATTVSLADELLRRGTVTREALTKEPRLVRFLPLVDGRAESRPESVLRTMLVRARLPRPSVQVEVVKAGRVLARLDLAYEEYGVALEYEGLQHATDTQQWTKDIARYRELEALGWTVIRVTAAMMRDPVALVRLVDSTLRRRGYRDYPIRLGRAWLADVA